MITLHPQKGIGYASTLAYSICLSLGAISMLVVTPIHNLQVVIALKTISNLLIGYLPAFALTYILGYIIQSQRLSYRIFIVLALVPALLLLFVVMRLIPGVPFYTINSQNSAGISPLDVWGLLLIVYSLGLLVASIILTISASGNSLKPLKIGSLVALDGAIFASIVLDGVSFTNFLPMVTDYDLMLVGFILVGVALLFSNRKILEPNLLTRDELFDSINDGIIIINNQDKILDLNPAAEQLLGTPTQKVYGNPVETILTNWNSISNSSDAKEKEFRGSINLNQQWHHISVRINKFDDDRGKVIFLRDITDRKDTNEVRQQAREEMFNLLRSFFKSASTSQSTNDFFRDVLFQIAYTFHAESGAICLVDPLPKSKKFKFSLMAKYGELMEEKETLTNLQETLVSSKWILGNREPLIISDSSQNPQFTKVADRLEGFTVAVFPLLYNEQMMGVLILARTESAGFIPDEIVRLSVVTEELASFIYSDRKRKSDIALAERHRLAQDLHDSITQKLYGLVTLTEAVKLGLESGAPVDENKMVDKISENARQALREMRLFLFELEPVDIERDGLVSTIQQRLASVEGRSGIQARMISDTEILLSVEKETEIYYIVEEALNNILKHANAKSVLVKLKQRKESIYLEIVDNGCGFDFDKVKFGGKGLGNIKERAKRIKGKLNIDSSPEHGTKITLTVPT
ncbi:MAG: GAF domain-containing sensor histidine kinase [Anaerolineales bacterium]